MHEIMAVTAPFLPEEQPRYVMGVGDQVPPAQRSRLHGRIAERLEAAFGDGHAEIAGELALGVNTAVKDIIGLPSSFGIESELVAEFGELGRRRGGLRLQFAGVLDRAPNQCQFFLGGLTFFGDPLGFALQHANQAKPESDQNHGGHEANEQQLVLLFLG